MERSYRAMEAATQAASTLLVDPEEQMRAISGSAQPVLDSILREAGVTPAPSP